MAQILNSIKSSNKEYSETKYKYETEIREFQELIEKEKNKKLDGWLVEKKDFLERFNKQHFWIIEILLGIFMVLFLLYSGYTYLYYPFAAFIKKLIFFTFILVALFFLSYLIYYFTRYLLSQKYINNLNLSSDNKIKTYEEKITELKKHFKTTLNSSKFIKKNKFLENRGKKAFVTFIKNNFDNNTFLINDFSTFYGKELFQIDHILITCKGVFCIEIKSGDKVYYPSTNNKWKYYSKDTECEIENPQETIIAKTEKLENILGNLCLQIIPAVVFTHPDSGFIGEATNKCKILNMEELPDYYKEKKIMFTSEQVKTISKMIFERNTKKLN